MTAIRNDSWENLTTGIGGPKDKSSNFAFYASYIDNDWHTLETLYEEDAIAAAIVDAPVDAVFLEGVEFNLSEQKEELLDELDRLEVESAVDQAMRWEGLYGGSAIFMGVNDGRRFEDPVNKDNIISLLYLHVLHRFELWPYRFYDDPKSAKFGKPSHYRVSPEGPMGMSRGAGVVVHESRLIIFGGVKTTKKKQVENHYWGQSELVRVYSSIKQYGGAMASVLALMSDASQGVYKIKNLAKMILAGQGDNIKARMRAIDEVRSALNAVLLDADGESFERIATPLTELANLVDRFMTNVAASARMPVTEIFGISAAGLNATGENDTRKWHKQVKKVQRKKAKPALEQILRIIFCSRTGPTQGNEPKTWSVGFPPVWSPTAKEAAEIKKIQTETGILAMDGGVLTPYQVGRGIFSGSELDGEIKITEEEIDALRLVALTGGISNQPSSLQQQETEPVFQENVDAEGEELSALNPKELAQRMTELGVQRCEHGKPNRCQLCGIERNREVTGVDEDGNGIWATSWRAIGQRAPAAEPDSEGAAA